jgi:nitrate/nitrite transporter NarK
MGQFALSLLLFLFYLVPTVLLTTPIVLLARKRVRWHAWEVLALPIPFCVWMSAHFFLTTTPRKSLSNAVIEPMLLALVVAVGLCVRVALTSRIGGRKAAISVLLGLAIAALAVFWIVPSLPE